LVGWNLTSLFSTNTAISETKLSDVVDSTYKVRVDVHIQA